MQPLARSYYEKLTGRYPQNYFGLLGAERLRALGPGPTQASDVLGVIPPAPDPPALDGKIPPAAADREARADALRSIAFDSSAELELRAAYAATGEPRLLFEAAQAAATAGQYGAAIVTVRQIFPQLESEAFTDIPRDVWLAAYALPYESSIRRWASKTGLDPHARRRADPPGIGVRARCALRIECDRADAASPQDRAATGAAAARGLFASAAHRSGLQREARDRVLRESRGRNLAASKRRSPRTMRAKIASGPGPPARTIASRRNSWNRFRSPRRASTCRSSRATRTSIAGSMERRTPMNPAHPGQATALH